MHARWLRAPTVAASDGRDGGGRVPREAPRHRRGRDRHWQDAGLSDPRDPQRAPRGDLDGDKILAGAVIREGRAVSAETFRAEAESGGDEGPRKFPLPRKGLPDGRPADAEGARRGGLVPSDPRLG